MRSIILASYSCLICLVFHILLGMSAANAEDERLVFADVEVSIIQSEEERINHRSYTITNNGRGAVFYEAFTRSNPILSYQFKNHLGNWEDAPVRLRCGTGLKMFSLGPNQSFTFESDTIADEYRVGVYVRTDKDYDVYYDQESKFIWSETR